MTVFRSLLLLLACTVPGWAALPLDAIRDLQKKAPERVQLTVTHVRKTSVKKRGDYSFDIVVHATVTKVHRSETELAPGSQIVIRYRIPDMQRSPAVGDWPPPVKKDLSYDAYLRKDGAKPGDFLPAANSGSFEALQPKAS